MRKTFVWLLSAALILCGCGGKTVEQFGESVPAFVSASDPASASKSGLASAGESGPAAAGESGPAAAGESGPAAAGESGPAAAGESGPAAVGESGGEAGAVAETIVVYVCGAVKSPGVVELPEGARVADAIRKVGGLCADADTRLVNQARRLTDGEQVTILTEEEARAIRQDDAAKAALYGDTANPANAAPSGGTADPADGLSHGNTGGSANAAPSGGTAGSANADGQINLNRADAKTLTTLPGIGETRAEAIVRYRETFGPFATIEDICKVSGIKGAVFEKIKDRITV